jgi:Zn-dependent membrane protease YugP
MIWVIIIISMLISWYLGYVLKSKFKEYAQIPIGQNLSGKEVAERMLNENGINDVKVISVEGSLTDHYNHLNKTVNLSPDVYNGRNVAATAVAAHECGHAVQHANAYSFLQMRSALVPVVSFSSNWVQWILLAGVLMMQSFPYLLLFGIVLFGLTTLFSFITLPVEIDASRRALIWLSNSGLTSNMQHEKAKDALKWAAYTYVVAALSSLAVLLYYISLFLGGRRN